MGILYFETIKKVMSEKERIERFVADDCVPGSYVQNMTREDSLKWKAKHIKGKDERIEIRKSVKGDASLTQIVILVYKNRKGKEHENVRISANGKIHFTFEEMKEFELAIKEAKEILNTKKTLKDYKNVRFVELNQKMDKDKLNEFISLGMNLNQPYLVSFSDFSEKNGKIEVIVMVNGLGLKMFEEELKFYEKI